MRELTFVEYIEKMRRRQMPGEDPRRSGPPGIAEPGQAPAGTPGPETLAAAMVSLAERPGSPPPAVVPIGVREFLEGAEPRHAPHLASWRAARDLLEGLAPAEEDFRQLLRVSPFPFALADRAVEIGAARPRHTFGSEYLAARVEGTASDPMAFAGQWPQASVVSEAMARIRSGDLTALPALTTLHDSTGWVAALAGWDRESVGGAIATSVLTQAALWPAVAGGLPAPTSRTARASDATAPFASWWVLTAARDLLRDLRFDDAADLVEGSADRWRGTRFAETGHSILVVALAAASRPGEALRAARAAEADGHGVVAASWIEVLSSEPDSEPAIWLVSPYLRLGAVEGSEDWADCYARLAVTRAEDPEGFADLLDAARSIREGGSRASGYLTITELASPGPDDIRWHLPALGTDIDSEFVRLVRAAAAEAHALLADPARDEPEQQNATAASVGGREEQW